MTKDETSKYSDLRDDGIAELFTFPMGVKSIITSPSPGLDLLERGIYQISGIVYFWFSLCQLAGVSATNR